MKRIIVCISALVLLSGLIRISAQTSQTPLFTFGVISDVQYADLPDSGNRHYRKSPAKLSEAVGHFNAAGVAFVVSLGDFINDHIKAFDTLNAITSGLKMPLYHVAGNHDFDPQNPDPGVTMRKMNLKSLNYAFSRNGWRFIILDGNDISLYTSRKGSKDYTMAEKVLEGLKNQGLPNAQPWNGGIGKKQMAWLSKELSKAQKKEEKVILACHFPLQSTDKHGILWNSAEVLNRIEAFPNVFAYFSGHGHISQHAEKEGIHHVMFRGIVEGSENAFSVISVYPDHLRMEGLGSEVSRILKP
jgi:manganese-dependent ADP-ribose/CDP-alcohol diphosphatase